MTGLVFHMVVWSRYVWVCNEIYTDKFVLEFLFFRFPPEETYVKHWKGQTEKLAILPHLFIYSCLALLGLSKTWVLLFQVIRTVVNMISGSYLCEGLIRQTFNNFWNSVVLKAVILGVPCRHCIKIESISFRCLTVETQERFQTRFFCI